MRRPRLLDLFCKAGGAAKGYHDAGFEVVGVDIEPQPNYPYEFHREDWLAPLLAWPQDFWAPSSTRVGGFDAIHASPPCQHYARVTRWRGDSADHPDLVAQVRDRLVATGLPYVIENVYEAPLQASLMLCGSMFGLKVRRHRYFEAPWMDAKGERAYADAMCCTWMTNREGREAIPPAYTEFIGAQLLAVLKGRGAA